MASYRTDISDEELFKNYNILGYVSDNCRYRVNIYKRGDTSNIIGAVELVLGRWKIIGDFSEEIRDLVDAIRKAVNIYLKCQNEFDELQIKFRQSKEEK